MKIDEVQSFKILGIFIELFDII